MDFFHHLFVFFVFFSILEARLLTNCKYIKNRIVPITYQSNEDFSRKYSDGFFICQVISGCAVLLIRGEKFFLSKNVVLVFSKKTEIEFISSYHFHAISIAFAPEFVNKNLNWKLIESQDYPLIAKELGYPTFEVFYKKNSIFEGVIPLEDMTSAKITSIIQDIIHQITNQPDMKWSCRARASLLELLDILYDHYLLMVKDNQKENSLEQSVLNYIQIHLPEEINIKMLCDLFHTNHTTISVRFKALTGKSIKEYIIDKRILLAKFALSFTDLSIEEISCKYGFYDASYFSKIFKKHIGISPLKYRIEMRKKRLNNINGLQVK